MPTTNDGTAGAVSLEGGAVGSHSSDSGGSDAGAGSEYVEVHDTTTTRLTYLTNASVEEGDSCPVHATGSSGCGFVDLRLSACGALSGSGACLDTASTEPYYTDSSGKRWTMLTLGGRSDQLNGEQADGIVDLDLKLSLSDGATSRELAVRAHVCARIVATLVPCK